MYNNPALNSLTTEEHQYYLRASERVVQIDGEDFHDKAEATANHKNPNKRWDAAHRYYLYLIIDPRIGGSLYDAAVYVGIGTGNRCKAHLDNKGKGAGAKRPEFAALMEELKAEGYGHGQVTYVLGHGFIGDGPVMKQLCDKAFHDQRNITMLETNIIQLLRMYHEYGKKVVPIVNDTAYWTPSKTVKGVKARIANGDRKRDMKQSAESVAKRKKANTNDLVLDLYKHDIFIHRFESTSGSDIVRWIRETHGETVNAGSLWRTAQSHSKQKTAGDGWRLHDVFDRMEKPDEKHSLLMAMGMSRPAVLEHRDGRKVLVWSYRHHDCVSLGYDGGHMGSHLRRSGCFNGVKGWRGRFLTETEVAKLMKLAPVHHAINVDGVEHIVFNTNLFCREKGITSAEGMTPPSLLKVLKGRQSYAILNNKRVTGTTIFTGRLMAQAMTPDMLSLLDNPIIEA